MEFWKLRGGGGSGPGITDYVVKVVQEYEQFIYTSNT